MAGKAAAGGSIGDARGVAEQTGCVYVMGEGVGGKLEYNRDLHQNDFLCGPSSL